MKTTGRGLVWLATLFGLLAIAACERPSQDASAAAEDPAVVVLARVGDEVVTSDDLGFIPVRANTSGRLDELVMRKVAAAEARRRGLDKDPKTRAKLADFRRNLATWEEGLLRTALYNAIRVGMTVSEEDLRAHYEKTKQKHTGALWEVRVQKFPSHAEAHAAAAALGAEGRLDVAQSETIGPGSIEQFPPELQAVVSKLVGPGDRIIDEFAGGWSVLELETFTADAVLPFEAAREKVEFEFRAERARDDLQAELARLRNEQVTIDEAALAKLEADRSGRAAKQRAERETARAAQSE